MATLEPKAEYDDRVADNDIDRGYFQIVQADYFAPDGSLRVKAVTRVKLKGVEFIRRRLDQFIRDYMERQNAGL